MGKWSHRNLATLILVALAVAGAIAACWPSQQTLPPPPITKSRAPVPQPLPPTPGVYLLGKSWPSLVYAVTTSDGLVLVDSGLEASAATVISQLAELRLDVGQFRAILVTHVHGDHSLGAARLRELTGAKIYAGRGDCKALREGGPREAFFSTFHRADVKLHKTTVDVELAGTETITKELWPGKPPTAARLRWGRVLAEVGWRQQAPRQLHHYCGVGEAFTVLQVGGGGATRFGAPQREPRGAGMTTVVVSQRRGCNRCTDGARDELE